MKQVVSVKLPPPGQGQAPVSGSTAGSGRSGAQTERPTSEMVALAADDTPVRIPEGDAAKAPTAEAAASAEATATKHTARLEAQRQARLRAREELGDEEAATAAGDSDKPLEGSATAAKPDGADDAARDGRSSGSPPRGKSGVRQTPRGPKKEQKGNAKDAQGRPAKQPLTSRDPRRRSAPVRGPRSSSEPPQTALSDGAARTPSSTDPRLMRLIAEIESHLHQIDTKPPSDATGWLRETAQLELFEEEIRWLLAQREKEEADKPSTDQSPTSEAKVEAPAPARTEDEPPEPGPRSEKDLHSALLQLRNCEREHAYLMQLLGCEDAVFREERLQEIRDLEEEIEKEQRRVRHMDAENRRRERALARVAALAASSMHPESDGNGKALRQAEQLESECAVWQVKNENLQKQVLQLNIYTKQDLDKQDHLAQKLKALREKLESEEAKQWIEEQRQREEERWNEEQALTAEVKALQDRRVSDVQATKKAHTEMQRQLVDLRKKTGSLEPRLAHLDSLEKQLRRQWRQLARLRRRESGDNLIVSQDGGSEAELPGSVAETPGQSFALVAETLAQHVLTTRPSPEESNEPSADANTEPDDAAAKTQKPSSQDPPLKEPELAAESDSPPEIGISLEVEEDAEGLTERPPAEQTQDQPGIVSVG